MAKKLVSSVALHKKKRLFKKVLRYLKSDLYMFAPLFSNSSSSHDRPHDSNIPAETGSSTISTGIDETNEACSTEKLNNKLHEINVGDYLKSDCYMYAPLLTPQPWLYASSTCTYVLHTPHKGTAGFREQDADDTGRQSELMKKVVSEDKKEQQLNGHPRGSRATFRHSILQQETHVHHILHRKVISPSAPPGKRSVESGGKKACC